MDMRQLRGVVGTAGAGWAISTMLLLSACGASRAQPSGAVDVEISHLAGAAPLQLNDGEYHNAAGDSFRVSHLRYYLSNFRLHRRDGQWFAAAKDAKSSDGYYLIDAADPASLHFSIKGVPDGDYDGVEFLVGIDPERNQAGVQTGTLDPARGLFWTWKSGYIFVQFEGSSPQSPVDGNELKFHLGGDTAARTLYLSLAPKAAHVDARTQPEIHLHADVAELFHGTHEIHFAELHHSMGDASGALLSDNLPGVFRVDHVHNEPRAAPHSP